MNVLFTGHKGFLGREVIPELSDVCHVNTYEGDLNNFSELLNFTKKNKIQKVIHAATRGGRRTRIDSHRELANNISIGLNVVRLELPVLSMCSGAIYGRQENISEAKEIEASNRYPNDYYGQSKFLLREILQSERQVKFLRFFNVFGPSETEDRFLTGNVKMALNGKPMQVFQDFKMDFFYVKDTIPVMLDWLNEKDIPSEINMVYPKKYFLSQICELINELTRKKVKVNILNTVRGKDYCGDGTLLMTLDYQTLGLSQGISEIIRVQKRQF